MDLAKTIIEGTLNILAVAAALLAMILVGLFLIRLLPIVLPVAFRVAMALGLAIGKVLAAALGFILQMVPLLVQIAVVCATIYLTIHGAIDIWHAYGSDLWAMLPASVTIVVTLAAGLEGRSFAALLASGVIVFAIGVVTLSGSLLFKYVVIVAALSLTIAVNQFKRVTPSAEIGEQHHGTEEEQHRISNTDQDWPDRIHGSQIDRSGVEHAAR